MLFNGYIKKIYRGGTDGNSDLGCSAKRLMIALRIYQDAVNHHTHECY